MVIADTSGVLALIDRAEPDHEATLAAITALDEQLVLSPFVLAEIDYLLATRRGLRAEVELLTSVSLGEYALAPFDAADVARAQAEVLRYGDLGLGLADASLIVLAERHDTTTILTLDERHFRAVRPRRGGDAFRLLPADGID